MKHRSTDWNQLKLMAAVIIILSFSSCKKYEDGPRLSLKSKKARLVGEWEVVDVENARGFEDGSIILEFDKDGDFTFSYEFFGYDYSFDGDWEWEDNKEVIQVEIDNSNTEWEIMRLTNSEFWFEDEDNNLWECEKK